MRSDANHWNNIFVTTSDDKVGWYEASSDMTLKILNSVSINEGKLIFLAGAGTTVLIEGIMQTDKSAKLIINDISIVAINKLKDRLGYEKSKEIIWVCQDIAQPLADTIPKVDIWIDRAVLHFLTDEDDIVGYFNNLQIKHKTGGYVLFAEFAKTAPPKCAGLYLHRYSVQELSERLGKEYLLIKSFDYDYINPWGDKRQYIYALFKRQ